MHKNYTKQHLYPVRATRSMIWRGRRSLALLALLTPVMAMAQAPDSLVSVRDNSQNLRMRLYTNGAFFLGGTYTGSLSGNIPVEGAGTRLLWYPEKAAFRAGFVTGTQWDDANVGLSSLAIGEEVRASGDNSIAMGKVCVASGFSALAIGENNTASGATSVALGYHSHTNARQGSFVFTDRSSVDTLRAGVNHSANWRVSGGFRIFTSSNLSTGVTIQSGASVSNWGQSSAVISSSTGAMLTTGGVWQNASDVNRKHLFEDVSGEEILKKLRLLPVRRWSYRSESDQVRHIGPTSQDFYAAFGLGSDQRSIGTVDADGIALAGIQALEARTTLLSEQIELLKAENAALKERLDNPQTSGPFNAALPLVVLLGGAGLTGFMMRRRKSATQKAGQQA